MRSESLRRLTVLVVVTVSAAATMWLVGHTVAAVAGNPMQPWILGRASGLTTYLLLVALVGWGMVLSHPARSGWRWPSAPARIRIHVSLAVFTLAFLVLHIVVLATDQYAGVGWRGAFVPMASTYRPMPVTLGVIGAYAGLLAGLTAAFAGRISARVWWPVHKVAALILLVVWVHAVLAGSDSLPLLALYVASGLALALLALSRYTAKSVGDTRNAMAARTQRSVVSR